MTLSTPLPSPLPVQHTHVILHRREAFLLPASIVPLDPHNSSLFADWDLEEWEALHKVEWYRRAFVRDLLRRELGGPERSFLLLTRLVDFPQLVAERLDRDLPLTTPLPIQAQAALTVEIRDGAATVIYNIETAPWNKFGPDRRFVSRPAAALFFFAAQHHLATTPAAGRFILSYPTDDGTHFYRDKLGLDLRWSTGMDRYAVVCRDSLHQALLRYREELDRLQEVLPVYRPD
jgi:hypothetical protein